MSLTRPSRLALVAACLLALTQTQTVFAAPDDDRHAWHSSLTFQNRHAAITAAADGTYHLTYDGGTRDIAAQAWRTETASPLFDGLFALAQAEAKADSVDAVHEGRFDHGNPMECVCFATGKKWPYVWTRDLSFSLDLGLWRLDPDRARNSLLFKQSDARGDAKPGEYVMQDTGSGGSWPVSTDRVAWFVGASHLTDNPSFAATFDRTLADTLAQDRLYAFDPVIGLYRGETSFLDWREQTYPGWTRDDVAFIGQSFALSTNVLHYEALRMAARRTGGAASTAYSKQADALKKAINARFWREDRGLYMSYIGGDVSPLPFDTYDLLGMSLAVTSGVADDARARMIVAKYPTWPSGSPVIWPERPDQAIYHNRAIWPFVSAYALRAARAVDSPSHIEQHVRSIMRGAALSGSNMENFEMLSQKIHVEDGSHSGPVIDSPSQLWSVAGYVGMVVEGVFGVDAADRVTPKLPVTLVPMLFGDRTSITLSMGKKRIVLQKPTSLAGNLLVAEKQTVTGDTTTVVLKAVQVADLPLRENAPQYAPGAPALTVTPREDGYAVTSSTPGFIYVNGVRHAYPVGSPALQLPRQADQRCISATALGEGLESMPTREQCVGETSALAGANAWKWTAPRSGTYDLSTWYENTHQAVDGGITAAVAFADVACGKHKAQALVIVMPHSAHEQRSTLAQFEATKGDTCAISLRKGFNMSDLTKAAHYTEGPGGLSGPVNEADVVRLEIRSLRTE